MKIDIKELRIGNLALFDGRVVVVYGLGRIIFDYGLISDHVDIYNIDDHEDDYVSIKSLKPIPLTEEWLLRFGFVKDSEYDNTFNLGIEVLNGFKDFTIDIRAKVLLLDCMEIKIEYVHQLQNLYFAMTGEDLEFKTKNQ
jgi:hypothetical protein